MGIVEKQDMEVWYKKKNTEFGVDHSLWKFVEAKILRERLVSSIVYNLEGHVKSVSLAKRLVAVRTLP